MEGINLLAHRDALSRTRSGLTAVSSDSVEHISETRLNSGIHVLSEYIPSVRSAAVGVWVRQGSAHETDSDSGLSHLLEHMVFKGTERRSASEIALSLESLGGFLDAYTTREHTSYQARVLDEHLEKALGVLADLTLAPLLSDNDLELEREVILEEIAQVQDTPDDLVFEMHSDQLWQGHPYGRSILGTKTSVSQLSSDKLRQLHQRTYRGKNLIVAAAGNLYHEELVEAVSRLFPTHSSDIDDVSSVVEPEGIKHGDAFVTRTSAQTHIVFGTNVPGHCHPDRYPLALLSSALGGGMSSRLFQKIREEMGLCYSIYTYQSFHSVAGISGVYVATRPTTAQAAVEAISTELATLAASGLTAEELDKTKRQVKGQVMLSLESTGSRLHRLASFALHKEPFMGLNGVLEKIDAVSLEEIQRVAEMYYSPDRHFMLRLGPETI